VEGRVRKIGRLLDRWLLAAISKQRKRNATIAICRQEWIGNVTEKLGTYEVIPSRHTWWALRRDEGRLGRLWLTDFTALTWNSDTRGKEYLQAVQVIGQVLHGIREETAILAPLLSSSRELQL
jgi:hypothetical protein